MTFTLLIVIGAVVGWFLPRLMGGESYGIPGDLGVAIVGALLGGLVFNAAVGGWFAGAFAATLFAATGVVALRQVKKVRDRQEAALVASRAASRRARAGARY
jgi:uncharacterized membrane protein YeaQ/YmgE (transglycosylase-associated protein family)